MHQNPQRDPALYREWDDATAINAGEVIEGLVEHPGWEFVLEALDALEKLERLQLLHAEPTANGAAYADRVGKLKGLAQARGVAENIIEHGRWVEAQLREAENG